jgi:hypothetical protein
VIAHTSAGKVPVCVRSPAGRTCELVGEHTELALAACPSWLVGNDGAGYYHVVSVIPAPPIADLTPQERIARGDDVIASFRSGSITTKDAVVELAELAKAPDPYAVHAAAAIARALDPLVDDATRPAWAKWLATRFAAYLLPGPILYPTSPASRQVRDDLVALIPDQMASATTLQARRRLEDTLRSKEPEPDPALVAISHDGKLFDRLATLARTSKDFGVRAAAFESLGLFGTDEVEHAIDIVLAADAPVAIAWPAIAGYFERAATRNAAWQALRARIPALLSRITGVEASMVVEVTASLCESTLRAEVAAAFEPHVGDIYDGRRILDHALASIDRCVSRRARAGDIAAALR